MPCIKVAGSSRAKNLILWGRPNLPDESSAKALVQASGVPFLDGLGTLNFPLTGRRPPLRRCGITNSRYRLRCAGVSSHDWLFTILSRNCAQSSLQNALPSSLHHRTKEVGTALGGLGGSSFGRTAEARAGNGARICPGTE